MDVLFFIFYHNVISRVSGITANLVAHDFTAGNISLALRGSVIEASRR
ncbi:hypothetical protein [Endozoicomonas sp. ALC020]